MTHIHSYPFYISNWRQSEAVTAMTAEQRGVFRELLDQCWAEGSLPTDEVLLRKFARVTEREWKRAWPTIQLQFQERDGRLWNAMVDEKRPLILESKEDRKRGANETNRRKAAKRLADAQRLAQRDTMSDAQRTPPPSPSPSPSPSHTGIPQFQIFRAAYESSGKPLNDGDWIAAAMEWASAELDRETPSIMAELDFAIRDDWVDSIRNCEWRFIPAPANWLKKQPWTRKSKRVVVTETVEAPQLSVSGMSVVELETALEMKALQEHWPEIRVELKKRQSAEVPT